MSKRFVVPVEVDENDECYITFPDEVMEDLGWYPGMMVEWSEETDGSIIVKKSEDQS
jgi:bifunctional DNA-binding transcriptional regulator/antitoxin component of YhaV-PrlF toxin-antitoxin module